jgi:hypothetical protein
MSIYVSLVVALIGGILYVLLQPTPPTTQKDRIAERCRLLFFAGVLAFLLVVGGHITSLFGK